MKKRIICLFFVFVTISSTIASAATLGNKSISAGGACLIDFDSGEMLFGYNENTPMVPASMTKVMALYVIYDAIKAGKISLETNVPISRYVYNSSRDNTGSNVPLYYNTTYNVDQMLDMIAIVSACACVEAMAELTYGSVEGFRQAMNAKAAALGLNAVYYSITGISDNYISPHSMAWLVKSIITDHPEVLQRTSKKGAYLNGNWYSTTNKLLGGSYYYSGADGFKTGTSTNAGYCFCGTAQRNGKRFIAVAMRSSSGTERFRDVIKMLDYGFENASYYTPAPEPPQKMIQTTYHEAMLSGGAMPTFVYGGDGLDCFTVIAEDFTCYGYDTVYNNETKTLTLIYNPEKPTTQIDLTYYKSFPEYTRLFKVYDSVKNVEIIKNGETYTPNIILDLNGYIALGIDSGLIDFTGIRVE